MELLQPAAAQLVLAGAGALVLGAALLGASRRFAQAAVAARLDRASELSDRLGTALDFAGRVDSEPNPATRALMRAAIADALRAVPRADARAAAPFRTPRDLRALSAFVVVGAALASLSFQPGRGPRPGALALAATRPAGPPEEKDALDPDDLDYQRQFVEDMKQLAADTKDEGLKQMARELEEVLAQAARGAMTKQALLEKMDALERRYADGGAERLEKLASGLAEQGQELKKNEVTKRLGEALEKGDLDAARKELARLAEELDTGDLAPADQKKVAEALEKAADRQELKDRKDNEQERKEAQQKIDRQKEEIRRLEKQVARDQKDEQAKRTLDKERRELDRLERDSKAQEEKQQKRQLDRLSRDLKRAAESLKQKDQKQAAQDLRQGAEKAEKLKQQMKKLQNQQRVQAQLRDLKDAIRRAKPQKGGGQKGMAEGQRQQRIKEWEQRAGGLRGNPQAWRQMASGSGQSQGQQRGPGKDGKEGPGGQEGEAREGQGPKGDQPGEKWGTGHDPHVQDDPTRMANAKFESDRLKGIQGQGPSRRETILTSAQKGFARAGYRKVYADYKKIVEEVMSQEKVPQGYQYYVKRYFQRIRPHTVD